MTSHDIQHGDSPRGDRPKRRHFTTEYKLRIVAEYEAAPEGEKGRVLRREGLYSTSIDLWRRQRDNGELTPAGPTAASRARKTPEQLELERLRKENAALARDKAKTEKKTRPGRGRPGHHGKRFRALGNDLRERGQRALVTSCRREMLGLLAAVLPINRSCTLAGVPRGSYYRGLAEPAEREAMPRPAPPNKLTEVEREELIGVLNSTPFVDKAPRQVWAALLDSGTYLASVSTMYRLLVRHEALLLIPDGGERPSIASLS